MMMMKRHRCFRKTVTFLAHAAPIFQKKKTNRKRKSAWRSHLLYTGRLLQNCKRRSQWLKAKVNSLETLLRVKPNVK